MRYLIIILFFTVISCVEFQQMQLPQTDPVNSKLALGKVPASDILLINNTGIIDDFNQPENYWRDTSKAIFSDVLNGYLRIHAENAGDSADFIYRKFNPLNFSEATSLVIPGSFSGEGLKTLQLTLIDEQGYQNVFIPEIQSADTLLYSIKDLNQKEYLSRIVEIQLRIIADSVYSGIILLDYFKALK